MRTGCAGSTDEGGPERPPGSGRGHRGAFVPTYALPALVGFVAGAGGAGYGAGLLAAGAPAARSAVVLTAISIPVLMASGVYLWAFYELSRV